MAFEVKATIATFGGKLLKLTHQSTSTGTPMNVSVYLPPAALQNSPTSSSSPLPVLFYLSGLTCTPDNCTEKGFLHAAASPRGIAVVYPDTSPRGANIAGEDESYDFGTGAGFYVDATAAPWSAHYRMETYVASELPDLLFSDSESGVIPGFPGVRFDRARASITGHSMGGHGALTLFLKYPGRYRSVSAFAPIANPVACPWGQKAFAGYLGDKNDEWKRHDATELVRAGKAPAELPALIDVGTGDNFYKQGQLLPENLEAALREKGVKGVEVRYHADYDHSYYFISTFAQDHVNHAAKYLL
ncbi:Alpha/Beta hydrolase protein [Biscogniauxia mediterranea]|nr:Alpha/Beta hydrolase protein [Biscogniauxia mediterranea]